jgi:hypothetical protein
MMNSINKIKLILEHLIVYWIFLKWINTSNWKINCKWEDMKYMYYYQYRSLVVRNIVYFGKEALKINKVDCCRNEDNIT